MKKWSKMVDVKLIKDTITELLSANVDKETIYSTLKDIGVDLSDIEKYYNEVASKKEEPEKTENSKESSTEEATNTEETEKPETETIEPENPKLNKKTENPKPKTTTEELEEATNDVINTQPEIKVENTKPISFSTTIEPENNKEQLLEIETKLSEVKAQISGLTKIMKDILEENRNILNKLK